MQTLLRPWHSLTRSPLRRAFTLAGAALGVVLWLALAPAALGGSSTYVTTYGISMEPILHKGDLAIVRPQPEYRVGDIVAYKSESLHTVVLHRIIGRDGERFVFKGDNNTWIDTDRPLASALIGRMDMKVPGFGTRIQQLASPPGIGAIAAVAALPVASRGRRRKRNHGADAEKPARRTSSRPMLRHVPPRLLVASAVAVGALALSFTKPPTTHGTSDLPFDDRGEFTYTGAAPGGEAVYQADTVSSGQPVFLNLVDSIDVGFTYSASSLAPVVARGDVGLRAQVSDSSGWTYPLDLAVPVHFEGTDAHVSGTLNLHDLQATIANMEAATGVKRDSYTVLISASVNREVRRSDAVVAGLFAP
ncbi:MAG: hypothetical protein QOG30_2176, partial [Acidimicrobiaceae bacterium]